MDNVVMIDERDERNTWSLARVIRLVAIVGLVIVLVYFLKDYYMPTEKINLQLESPSVIEMSQIEIKGMKGGFL